MKKLAEEYHLKELRQATIDGPAVTPPLRLAKRES